MKMQQIESLTEFQQFFGELMFNPNQFGKREGTGWSGDTKKVRNGLQRKGKGVRERETKMERSATLLRICHRIYCAFYEYVSHYYWRAATML